MDSVTVVRIYYLLQQKPSAKLQRAVVTRLYGLDLEVERDEREDQGLRNSRVST